MIFVARISSSRLKNLPRPLRLCYYGEVVRNDVSILRPERQFLQIGAECIGENSYLADIEILILTFKSLDSVGIKDISVDFSTPIFLDKKLIIFVKFIFISIHLFVCDILDIYFYT